MAVVVLCRTDRLYFIIVTIIIIVVVTTIHPTVAFSSLSTSVRPGGFQQQRRRCVNYLQPQLLLIQSSSHHYQKKKNTIIIMPEQQQQYRRRRKTQKLLSQSSGDDDSTTTDETEKKTNNQQQHHQQQQQLVLTKLYRGISMLHFGQIIMAIKKSRGGLLSLGCLTVIGGPFMAFGLMLLLGSVSSSSASNQQQQQQYNYLAMDTFKRLNGVLVLYATLSLCLVALLVPQLYNNPFGMLWFISATTTTFVAVKGYFFGLKKAATTAVTDEDNQNMTFFSETIRLFQDASRITLSMMIPPRLLVAGPNTNKIITFGDVCCLWTIAIRKVSLLWEIFQILLSIGLEKSQIAPKLSQLAKLTLLGGSLVTVISMNDDEGGSTTTTSTTMERDLAMIPLTVMMTYVFSTMAAFDILHASKPFELVYGCMLGVCAILSTMKGIRSWRERGEREKFEKTI